MGSSDEILLVYSEGEDAIDALLRSLHRAGVSVRVQQWKPGDYDARSKPQRIDDNADRRWRHRVIERLAETFNERNQATALAIDVGFRRGRIPDFTNAEAFWTRLVDEVLAGALKGGPRLLLERAAERYPDNSGLRDLLGPLTLICVGRRGADPWNDFEAWAHPRKVAKQRAARVGTILLPEAPNDVDAAGSLPELQLDLRGESVDGPATDRFVAKVIPLLGGSRIRVGRGLGPERKYGNDAEYAEQGLEGAYEGAGGKVSALEPPVGPESGSESQHPIHAPHVSTRGVARTGALALATISVLCLAWYFVWNLQADECKVLRGEILREHLGELTDWHRVFIEHNLSDDTCSQDGNSLIDKQLSVLRAADRDRINLNYNTALTELDKIESRDVEEPILVVIQWISTIERLQLTELDGKPLYLDTPTIDVDKNPYDLFIEGTRLRRGQSMNCDRHAERWSHMAKTLYKDTLLTFDYYYSLGDCQMYAANQPDSTSEAQSITLLLKAKGSYEDALATLANCDGQRDDFGYRQASIILKREKMFARIQRMRFGHAHPPLSVRKKLKNSVKEIRKQVSVLEDFVKKREKGNRLWSIYANAATMIIDIHQVMAEEDYLDVADEYYRLMTDVIDRHEELDRRRYSVLRRMVRVAIDLDESKEETTRVSAVIARVLESTDPKIVPSLSQLQDFVVWGSHSYIGASAWVQLLELLAWAEKQGKTHSMGKMEPTTKLMGIIRARMLFDQEKQDEAARKIEGVLKTGVSGPLRDHIDGLRRGETKSHALWTSSRFIDFVRRAQSEYEERERVFDG